VKAARAEVPRRGRGTRLIDPQTLVTGLFLDLVNRLKTIAEGKRA